MSRLTNNEVSINKDIKGLLSDSRTKARFDQVLGQKAPKFISSILSIATNDKLLKEANPVSIIQSALVAASLDLPIEKNLGFAYIVPYKEKGVPKAQFQMGYKGFIQLAMRSGQYKKINVSKFYEGQFISYDPIVDELEYDLNNKLSDKVTHYVAYFKTVNGFEKFYIMSKEEMENHAKTYSQTYKKGFGNWKDNFDVMAEKTVIKLLLSKYGILSTEIQTAIKTDQAIIKDVTNDDVEVEYVDGENGNTEMIEPEIVGPTPVEEEAKEVFEEPVDPFGFEGQYEEL